MGLVASKSKKLDYYLRRIRTETVHIVLTVHDEIDYLADFSILKPLTKKLSQALDISEYYKKYNVPFIRYLFDIEYDEWGAWTAGKAVDVYSLPVSREENTAYNSYKEAVDILKGSVSEANTESDIIPLMKVDFTSTDIKVEEFVARLEKLPEGKTVFKVKVSEKKSLKFYKCLEQNALLSLVSELGLELID
jgi:hypothetical protein